QFVRDLAQALVESPAHRELLTAFRIRAIAEMDQQSPLDTSVALVLGHGTRLRMFVAAVTDQVHRRGEKAIVWVAYPATQKLVASLMAALGIAARAFLATLDAGERAKLVAAFNDAGDRLKVLVCNYVC